MVAGRGHILGSLCIRFSRLPKRKVAGTEVEKPGLAKWGFLFPPSFFFFLKQEINKCHSEMTRER